jgi:hypothetical protein
MAYGSRIVVAEAFLSPAGVNYRVATGPGWAALGGNPGRWSRYFATSAYPDALDGHITECQRALYHIRDRVGGLATWLDSVVPLPVGPVPDVVRSSSER